MKNYLLGIDIGTSACKVVVFRLDGSVAAQASAAYPVYYPQEGWAEQDSEDWWKAVASALKQIWKSWDIAADEIAGIGVDGQSWSAIAVDRSGKVLTNTPIWMDTRAAEICDKLKHQVGAERIFDLASNSLQPSYGTAKVLWYKEQLPQVYEQIDTILQSNSFIVYRLTGEQTMDKSQGYGFHCFDMKRACWDEKMCEALGIPVSFLQRICECSEVVGKVTAEAVRFTGLALGTPVVAGGLDAVCATLGAGVIHPGETQEQGGQAGGMSICLETYTADPRLIMSWHVVPGRWLLQGGTTGGGGTLRWFEQEFAAAERAESERTGKTSFEQLSEQADEVSAGSEGLIFLPYMAGERSPIWNPKAKGVWYGMDFSKRRGHFARAIMEGVAYSLRHNLETARECGADTSELHAMGGSANSLVWTQIKADITGKVIKVPASDTATTLGAAILAGIGTGVYDSFEHAVRKTIKLERVHEPNPAHQAVYQKGYRTYLQLYNNLKEVMNDQEVI